jgi:hypothetical protein
MPRSRVVTADTFEKLLARLAPERERAGEEYENLRRRLTRYFDLKGLGSPDHAADETLDRLAQKIAAGEDVRDYLHYAFGIAQWVYLERVRAEDRERRARTDLAQLQQASFPATAPYLESLEDCLDKLANEDRELLEAYYSESHYADLVQQRIALAQARKLTLNSLRLRVYRLRQVLERCIRMKDSDQQGHER